MVRYVWFHIAFALCFALRVFAHLAWWMARLSGLPCRTWCNIIIIIAHLPRGCAPSGIDGAVQYLFCWAEDHSVVVMKGERLLRWALPLHSANRS
jgi:hypothetical protein